MKRILCLLCGLMLLLLCACGDSGQPDPVATSTPPVTDQPSPSPSPSPADTEEPTPPPAEASGPASPLTGLPMDESRVGQKPVAIMLNNIKAAMPQQGNSQADIIYEVLAEGGITRMVGIYQDISHLGVIGSVRSARLYYWELALGHDAVFVHAGGSEEFYSYAQKWGLSTVDGVNGYYSYSNTGLFWRDRERVEGNYYAYEHSLVTSGEKLTQILSDRGVLGAHSGGYTYEMTFSPDGTPADGQSALTVTVPFSNYKSTTFRYDEGDGLYYAEQYDQAYIDGNDGTQIAVTNLLILRTRCTVVDDAGRLSVDLSSGEGWFACGGKYIPITWEKGGRDQQLRYYTADGQPLTLGQGKSYVCIIPLSREMTAR